jgi:hypothetical protein
MRGRVRQALLVAVTSVVLAAPVMAQDMTAADVQRLQESVNDIGTDIATLRRRDPVNARALQAELDRLQEEVIYLKVKQRKEQNVPRAEFEDVRNRLETLRSRARGEDSSSGAFAATSTGRVDSGSAAVPAASTTRSTTRESDDGTIPVGAEIDVRLQTALSSETAQIEDRFEGTTMVDLRQDGRVLIPAGSPVRGIVTDVKKAGRLDRTGSLTLSFDQITINGRTYPMRGIVSEALKSGGYKEDAPKIGTGAAVGGIIGGIIGGFEGAITGILIGGGGVVAATEGEDVRLSPGTVLRVRFDQPLTIK